MNVELNPHLKSLSDKAVLSLEDESKCYKKKFIYDQIVYLFQNVIWSQNYSWGFKHFANSLMNSQQIDLGVEFFGDGVPCEILDTNQSQCQKGKLVAKLVLEFIPDEPESPLDEIRRDMDKYNS
ncbi:MAG: hypothetical protein GC158_04075 [Cyanobacteria bacterium RI_101]|nr:hypothetical protein [Cyanobacteria bacterium RI_101]